MGKLSKTLEHYDTSLNSNTVLFSDKWPQNGDKYYWVSTNTGDICKSAWLDGVDVCEFRKSIGNVFRTRFGAKEAIARQQAQNEDRLVAMK